MARPRWPYSDRRGFRHPAPIGGHTARNHRGTRAARTVGVFTVLELEDPLPYRRRHVVGRNRRLHSCHLDFPMSTLDWLVLFATLGAIVGYGLWKTRGRQDMAGYLRGGYQDKWHTIGLSVMATQASAVTFL